MTETRIPLRDVIEGRASAREYVAALRLDVDRRLHDEMEARKKRAPTDRQQLAWEDVQVLREGGYDEMADIAEMYLRKRRWWRL